MSGGQDANKLANAEEEDYRKHKDNELVDHPGHYNQGTIETIDFIEDRDHLGFNRQNAIKYIDRSGAKSSESKEVSLKKAIWYLEREMGMHKKEHQCDCG